MYKRILVPIDGSPTATRGLDEAIDLARLTGATLLLMHVLDELVFVTGFEPGATYMTDVLPMLKSRGKQVLDAGRTRVEAAGLKAETVLVECFGTRTSEVVVDQARTWDADLIVLGTHGRRGVSRLVLGSDAEQIARGSTMPVLLVRGMEPAAPKLGAAAPAAITAAARVSTAVL